MTHTTQSSEFQRAIDLVESLSLEDQRILLDVLQKRFHQRQRSQIQREVEEVRQDYAQGKVKFGAVTNFLAELDA